MRPLVIQHDPVAGQPNSVPTLLRRYWSVKDERRILPRHLRDEVFVVRILQEPPGLINSAVEEFLRWASPVYHFRRTATCDVELGGKQIKKDNKVVMWFASGNRAADVVNDPYHFDVTRTNVDHVTFGKAARPCAWAAPWPG